MSKITNIWEKYKKIETLGYGPFGIVYKAKYNNEYFAIKEIKKSKLDKNKFFKETKVMKK